MVSYWILDDATQQRRCTVTGAIRVHHLLLVSRPDLTTHLGFFFLHEPDIAALV
ncbi:MAG: hypothetical protein L0Z50_23605 [Verrucomicrobiales bacterium]|nr:hypothetical protein [Verrucomicrobiales bacterium]